MSLLTLACAVAFIIAAWFNPLNAELNPICHLLALLGGATIVVVSRLRVKVKELEISSKWTRKNNFLEILLAK